MLTIYKSDEAYTTEVKPNKRISIHVVRIIFYQEENGQFWSTLTLLITTAFHAPCFPPKFLPHFTICLDMSKNLKYADQLLHKQAKLISTSKLTRIRTIILWPVIYNNRFFFKDEWLIWSLSREVDLSTKVWMHRNDVCSWNRQGCSSASRTHKC